MAPADKAPNGTSKSNIDASKPANSVPANASNEPRGPHPGLVLVPVQYVFEQKIRQLQKAVGSDPTREDNYRLQGVQMIDNVRQALQLPVRTFDTAVQYYHRFRLRHREAEYSFQDSALAALFLACKVEDTIKKSKEILCAAYNLKNPDHQTTPDDKIFDQPSRVLVGLERLILEIIGFDFRTRYPQKYLAKAVRLIIGRDAEAKEFFDVAYEMSLDMYKTFVPVKQTTMTMCLTLLELTALVTGKHLDTARGVDPSRFHVTRNAIMESLLDLLELYTQFHKSTKLGTKFELAKWVDIKIKVNEELESDASLSRHEFYCKECEEKEANKPATGILPPATTSSVSSIRLGSKNSDSTVRFIFNRDQARREAETVAEYFKDDFEEYETEVEEPIPEPERFDNARDRGHHGPIRGGRGRHDGPGAGPGWGPYNRNHRPHHPHDRRGRRYH